MVFDKITARDSMAYLVWKLSRLMTNDLSARLSEAGYDITVEQLRPLFPLYKMDGLSQGQLCDLMSQEKTGVSRLVAALEKRGLVRRESGDADRRVKYIYITDAGRKLLEEAVDTVIMSRDEFIKDIDPDDLEVCKRVLWQIIEPSLAEYACHMQCSK